MLPEPFHWEGDHVAGELPGGRVLFSTRRGGVSSGPYASLNLGRLTHDDGANVDANRERLAAAVGLPRDRFLYGKQIHGARVRRATGPMGRHAEEDGPRFELFTACRHDRLNQDRAGAVGSSPRFSRL